MAYGCCLRTRAWGLRNGILVTPAAEKHPAYRKYRNCRPDGQSVEGYWRSSQDASK